jgi:hypothetical protein
MRRVLAPLLVCLIASAGDGRRFTYGDDVSPSKELDLGEVTLQAEMP